MYRSSGENRKGNVTNMQLYRSIPGGRVKACSPAWYAVYSESWPQ